MIRKCLRILFVLAIAAGVSSSVVEAQRQTQGASPVSGGESPSPDPSRLALFYERLEALAQQLDRSLERARDNDGPAAQPRFRAEVQHFRVEIDLLEVEQSALGGDRALGNKVRNLSRLVDNLELAAEGSVLPRHRRPRAELGQVTIAPALAGRGGVRGLAAAPTHDACASATPISLGETIVGTLDGATNDGSASCGASAFAPDVWFRYTAASSGQVSVDTFGSSFDTVISVHTACPGTTTNQWACNDDTFGLDSATSVFVGSGQSFWIRLAGFDSATGAYELHLGEGGAISGTVTEAATGDPIEGGRVEVYSPFSPTFFQASATTGADGSYSVAGLLPGPRLVATDVNGFLDELYDNVPCVGVGFNDCEVAGGEVVLVESHGATGDIDFALERGGAIAGTVTQSGTGAPIPGALIKVYETSSHFEVSSTVTGADGTYLAGGLLSGSYVVRVSLSGYVGKFFDDVPAIAIQDATPIEVTALQTTPDIDFEIDRLGVVQGALTHNTAGVPVQSATILILRAQDGAVVASTGSDADGTYEFAGLQQGSYKLVVTKIGYVTEGYDDVVCGFNLDYGDCALASLATISMDLNTVVADIDFGLDQLGSISGAVSDSDSGLPLSGAFVAVQDSNGIQVKSSFTDEAGAFLIEGLEPGTDYFVRAGASLHFTEVHDGILCMPFCGPGVGTPLQTPLNTHVQLDFALDGGGLISGRARDSISSFFVPMASVSLWDGSGALVASLVFDDPFGNPGFFFSFGVLSPGTYYLGMTAKNYIDELFGGVHCEGGPPGACDPTTGSPISVTASSTHSIEFQLDRSPGGIAGSVLSAKTGDPVPFASLQATRSGGGSTFGQADEAGDYVISRLDPGDYFVTAQSSQFLREVFEEVPCVDPCDSSVGTPVAVASSVVSGIDFTLDQFGRLLGTVSSSDGAPLENVFVQLWGPDPWSNVASFTTGASGTYGLFVPPGTHFLSTNSFLRGGDLIDELYREIPCLGACSPSKGDPIVVAPNTDMVINFSLQIAGLLNGVVMNADTGLPLEGATVDIWEESFFNDLVASATTGPDGNYSATVSPGSYRLSTRNAAGLVNQIHPAIQCPSGSVFSGDCSLFDGTVVEVALGETETIDFALTNALLFSNGFESGSVSGWSKSEP